jgi:hypothetical protein
MDNNTFIRIGKLYINVAHIIDIQIRFDVVRITTTELVAESVGEGAGWVATNAQVDYLIDTPEAKVVIAWADRQSEALV